MKEAAFHCHRQLRGFPYVFLIVSYKLPHMWPAQPQVVCAKANDARHGSKTSRVTGNLADSEYLGSILKYVSSLSKQSRSVGDGSLASHS